MLYWIHIFLLAIATCSFAADIPIRIIVKGIPSQSGKVTLTAFYQGNVLLLDRLVANNAGKSTSLEQFYQTGNIVYKRAVIDGSESQMILPNSGTVVIARYPDDIYPPLLSIQTPEKQSLLFQLNKGFYTPLSRSEFLQRSTLILSSFSTEHSDQGRQELQTEQGSAAHP